MPTTEKNNTSTITKKPIAKKPKKGSIEAIMKAAVEARKNGLDLSFLRP